MASRAASEFLNVHSLRSEDLLVTIVSVAHSSGILLPSDKVCIDAFDGSGTAVGFYVPFFITGSEELTMPIELLTRLGSCMLMNLECHGLSIRPSDMSAVLEDGDVSEVFER